MTHRPKTSAALTCALLFALVSSVPASAATDDPGFDRKFLEDPEWRARFMGSYGFLSGAEPAINASELEVLRDVLDLMKVNAAAAATMLEQRSTPESSAAFDFILANLHFQNDNLPAAIQGYQSALEKFPDFRRAHKNLGLLLVQQGDYAAAITQLSKAAENGDRDGRTFGLLGYCHLQTDNPIAAEVAYQTAILQEPDVRDWQLGLARVLLALEKFKEAVALFGSVLEASPEDANVWMLQANAYLGLDQPMKAAVNLETARLLGKPTQSSLVLLGDIYMNAGMPELASSAYLEVIESPVHKADFSVALRAANVLLRSQSVPEAEKVLAAIDARYSKNMSRDDELALLTVKARVARAEGRDKEAAKILQTIVERDGTRGDALLELADHYLALGDRERALLLLDRAEGLSAYEREALLASAKLFVSDRDYTKAAVQLRRALQLQHEPRVERFLARVEQAVRP